MWALTLLRVCLLRANPQDLPMSTVLTLFSVALYYATDVATALKWVSLPLALQAGAIDALLLVALTQAALNWRHQAKRLRQTVLALAGAGAIMATVTLALDGVLPQGISPEILWVLSTLWLFAVYGHILRHAFEVSYAVGLAGTAVYFLLSLLVTGPFLFSPDS